MALSLFALTIVTIILRKKLCDEKNHFVIESLKTLESTELSEVSHVINTFAER